MSGQYSLSIPPENITWKHQDYSFSKESERLLLDWNKPIIDILLILTH